MHGRIAGLVLVAGMALGAGALVAQGASRGSGSTTRPAQRQTVVKTIRGEIEAVNIEQKTLTVEVKEKQEMKQVVVATDPNTEVLLDSEPADLVDLRPGMRVSFQPETGVATRVSAKSMTAKEQKEFKEKKTSQDGKAGE